MDVSRRNFFSKSLQGAAAFWGASGLAEICRRTPAQGEGPFYPESSLARDADLTRFSASDALAEGDKIHLIGVVQDERCQAIPDALVEIWQANRHGKYDHSRDANPLPEDPNFQHWGQCRTDRQGEYHFISIIPGHYPLDPRLVGTEPSGPGQFRPPHIHMKVYARGFRTLTTQMYFDPRTYADARLRTIVSRLNQWERVPSDLTVRFVPDVTDATAPKTGRFNITLLRR